MNLLYSFYTDWSFSLVYLAQVGLKGKYHRHRVVYIGTLMDYLVEDGILDRMEVESPFAEGKV
jgi:hypothetical protein